VRRLRHLVYHTLHVQSSLERFSRLSYPLSSFPVHHKKILSPCMMELMAYQGSSLNLYLNYFLGQTV
jgi:hypothetical protein